MTRATRNERGQRHSLSALAAKLLKDLTASHPPPDLLRSFAPLRRILPPARRPFTAPAARLLVEDVAASRRNGRRARALEYVTAARRPERGAPSVGGPAAGKRSWGKAEAESGIPFGGPFPSCADFSLTPWEIHDVPAVLAASASTEIHAFTSLPTAHIRVHGAAAALDWITRQPQQRQAGGAVHFALRNTQGDVLGNVALIAFEWPHRRAEVGYWVLPPFRDRGVASRALDLLTTWAFQALAIDRIDLFVDPTNAPSKRVAERAGYVHEAHLRSFRIYAGRRCDLDLYRALSPLAPLGEAQ